MRAQRLAAQVAHVHAVLPCCWCAYVATEHLDRAEELQALERRFRANETLYLLDRQGRRGGAQGAARGAIREKRYNLSHLRVHHTSRCHMEMASTEFCPSEATGALRLFGKKEEI